MPRLPMARKHSSSWALPRSAAATPTRRHGQNVDGVDLTTKRMPRTPDYYGYFTFSSAPVKNFDFSLSGTYTGKMIVPHYAGYIAEDRMETTPQFFDLNLKLNYTFVLHDHIKFQLNTGVQNIFNSFQKDLDKGEFRDAGYFYGPTQPRTFFIGFKINELGQHSRFLNQ